MKAYSRRLLARLAVAVASMLVLGAVAASSALAAPGPSVPSVLSGHASVRWQNLVLPASGGGIPLWGTVLFAAGVAVLFAAITVYAVRSQSTQVLATPAEVVSLHAGDKSESDETRKAA